MQGGRRKVVSALEIIAGIVLVAIGLYSLVEALQCRPEATYCAPMTMLVVVVALLPGVIVLVAGAMAISNQRRSFLRVQLVMVGTLVVYFGAVYLFFLYIAGRL